MRFGCWITKATHTHTRTHAHTHTHTHGVCNTCFLFHNIGYANGSQCCVVRTLPFMLENRILLSVIYTEKKLSVDHAQGWGGNKNAIKSAKVTFTSFNSRIFARGSPGGRPQGSAEGCRGHRGGELTGLSCLLMSRLGCSCL